MESKDNVKDNIKMLKRYTELFDKACQRYAMASKTFEPTDFLNKGEKVEFIELMDGFEV